MGKNKERRRSLRDRSVFCPVGPRYERGAIGDYQKTGVTRSVTYEEIPLH